MYMMGTWVTGLGPSRFNHRREAYQMRHAACMTALDQGLVL